MAAISITRNTMLNLAKAFFPKSPYSPPPIPRLKSHGPASLPLPPNITKARERVEKARERSKDMKDKAKGYARETWHGLRLRRLKKVLTRQRREGKKKR
ncbi:hypothetical protein OIU85_027434 [Salix viminalis]|uniref:Uncharacterized protein n=1 Tax=Salix viminalis TaxID=40686 RepID=A0A9Q0QIH3_SALVM|nr:hypothetical protein OIU85_027434 [Salix viminalis]